MSDSKAYPTLPKLAIPQTMKAMCYRKNGKPNEVVQMEELPVPVPAAGEALIKVKAASISGYDYKMMTGFMFSTKRDTRPQVLAVDMCGVVVATNQCARVNVGDHVFAIMGLNMGGNAEYVVLAERLLVFKPAVLTDAEAAALPGSAVTSVQALTWARVGPGKKIVVLGGSTMCGLFAMQWAKKRLGVEHVVCTASPAGAELCRRYGADQVIDYHTQSWSDVLAGQKFDLVYDCVGGPTYYQDSKKVLGPSGTFLTIVGDHPEVPFDLPKLAQSFAVIAARKFLSLFTTAPTYHFLLSDVTDVATLDLIARAYEQQQHNGQPLLVPLEATVPFTRDAVVRAIEHEGSGHAHGKSVVQIAP